MIENIINGMSRSASNGATFEDRNPANSEDVIGIFPRSTEEDVDEAVKAARAAFPAWSRVTPPQRARYLHSICVRMESVKREFVRLIVREMGKTVKEAAGEMQAAIDMGYYIAGEGRRLGGATLPAEPSKKFVFTKRVPIGVAALITPWNAPVASIAWKLFPALVCGNTVVLKPSEDTPMCAQLFLQCILDADVPPGVVNLVHGFGEETGAALVRHHGVDIVSFTGSTAVGTRINEVCASRRVRVSLEMGGKNGVLVLKDADLDQATGHILSGAFSMAGQRCATTGRVIVEVSIVDALLSRLSEATRRLKVGPGAEETSFVCPIINKAQLDRVRSYIESAKEEGATLVVGGRVLSEGEYATGWYVEPTIFSNVTSEMKIAQEEVFGPVLAVMTCKNYEDGIRLMNSTAYGLTAAIFTKNADYALDAVDDIRAGVVYVNAPTFGAEVQMPFGGYGMSGNGHREAGLGGIEVFSEWKTVAINYSGTSS